MEWINFDGKNFPPENEDVPYFVECESGDRISLYYNGKSSNTRWKVKVKRYISESHPLSPVQVGGGDSQDEKVYFECHAEIIKCPECNTIQAAVVEHTVPFYSYVHECKNCKYIIMESEWDNPPAPAVHVEELKEKIEWMVKKWENTRDRHKRKINESADTTSIDYHRGKLDASLSTLSDLNSLLTEKK